MGGHVEGRAVRRVGGTVAVVVEVGAVGVAVGVGVVVAVDQVTIAVAVHRVAGLRGTGEDRRVQGGAVRGIRVPVTVVVIVDAVGLAVAVGIGVALIDDRVAVVVEPIAHLGGAGEDQRVVVGAVAVPDRPAVGVLVRHGQRDQWEDVAGALAVVAVTVVGVDRILLEGPDHQPAVGRRPSAEGDAVEEFDLDRGARRDRAPVGEDDPEHVVAGRPTGLEDRVGVGRQAGRRDRGDSIVDPQRRPEGCVARVDGARTAVLPGARAVTAGPTPDRVLDTGVVHVDHQDLEPGPGVGEIDRERRRYVVRIVPREFFPSRRDHQRLDVGMSPQSPGAQIEGLVVVLPRDEQVGVGAGDRIGREVDVGVGDRLAQRAHRAEPRQREQDRDGDGGRVRVPPAPCVRHPGSSGPC